MINNLLLSIQNQPPALLQVGVGRQENYQNLSALAECWWGDSQWTGSAGGKAEDMVSLAYHNIGQKIVSDLAGLTAAAIMAEPSLENDYFIALIETEEGREVRTYRRSEILAAFEGTAEEKKNLEAHLAANSLQVFSSAQGLPAASDDPACRALSAQIDGFLKTMSKTMDALKKAGHDPFGNFSGSSTALKALMAYNLNPASGAA